MGPPKPGTLGLLISAYRSSREFLDLQARTRADYQRCLDYLKPIQDIPLARLDRALVVRIRDKGSGRAPTALRKLCEDCFVDPIRVGGGTRVHGQKSRQKLRNIRRQKGAPEANRPWSNEERHVVLTAAPAHIQSAIALMMFTGLAPKDALRLPRPFYKEGEIATRRSKTGEPVWPAPAAVDVLSTSPCHDAVTLCANSFGRPWTESGFRASWRKVRSRL